MNAQVLLDRERFIAILAFVRLFTSVRSVVPCQSGRYRKRLTAVVALERAVGRRVFHVRSQVILKSVFLHEYLVAHVTLQRLVRHHSGCVR